MMEKKISFLCMLVVPVLSWIFTSQFQKGVCGSSPCDDGTRTALLTARMDRMMRRLVRAEKMSAERFQRLLYLEKKLETFTGGQYHLNQNTEEIMEAEKVDFQASNKELQEIGKQYAGNDESFVDKAGHAWDDERFADNKAEHAGYGWNFDKKVEHAGNDRSFDDKVEHAGDDGRFVDKAGHAGDDWSFGDKKVEHAGDLGNSDNKAGSTASNDTGHDTSDGTVLNRDAIRQQDVLMGKGKRLLAPPAATFDEGVAFSTSVSNHLHNLGAAHTILFDNVQYNKGHGYDKVIGVFICPVSGTYFFTSSLMSWTNSWIETEIVHEGVQQAVVGAYGAGSHGHDQGSNSVILHCNHGEHVWVRRYSGLNDLFGVLAKEITIVTNMNSGLPDHPHHALVPCIHRVSRQNPKWLLKK